MARVDFYLLRQSGVRIALCLRLQLAEKAYRLENTVQIHTATVRMRERIDDLLWTFRDGSFVPHDSAAESASRSQRRYRFRRARAT